MTEHLVKVALYLIPFLHQTTTCDTAFRFVLRCILFHFYIKPQPWRQILCQGDRCILFHFYIKPQPALGAGLEIDSCILFHFYIKPQLRNMAMFLSSRCILFHFYIKPQRDICGCLFPRVVSYSISTSNHNLGMFDLRYCNVVSYSISTSNHNLWRIRRYFQAHYHLNHILIFNGML